MTTVAEHCERLMRYYRPNTVIAAMVWLPEDAMERAKERGITLTQGEAETVIKETERRCDCTIGISWDVLDCHTDSVVEERR